ncbi:MAG: nitrate- and nitrite sensing domain-containing protein [Flavobacteriales bacterium]|nr:nitrate- and nitrite sensing domain-containing protein [Flavobacteriales bacterium]
MDHTITVKSTVDDSISRSFSKSQVLPINAVSLQPSAFLSAKHLSEHNDKYHPDKLEYLDEEYEEVLNNNRSNSSGSVKSTKRPNSSIKLNEKKNSFGGNGVTLPLPDDTKSKISGKTGKSYKTVTTSMSGYVKEKFHEVDFMMFIKLCVKTIFPFLIVAILLIVLLVEKYETSNKIVDKLHDEHVITQFTHQIANLLHETQLEQGHISIYLSTDSAKSKIDVLFQYSNTDRRIEKFMEYIHDTLDHQTDHISIFIKEHHEYKKVIAQLEDIGGIRNQVMTKNITINIMYWYNLMHADFIQVGLYAWNFFERSMLDNEIEAVLYLVKAKEDAGLERTYGAQMYAANHINIYQISNFEGYSKLEESYTSLYKMTTTPHSIEFFDDHVKGIAVTERDKLRNYLHYNDTSAIKNITADHWFTVSSGIIDLMRLVEEDMQKEIEIDVASGLAQVKKTKIAIIIELTAIVVFILGGTIMMSYGVNAIRIFANGKQNVFDAIDQYTTSIIEASRPIIAIDESFTVQTYNNAAHKLFGFPPDRIIGKSLDDLMNRNTAETHPGMMSVALQKADFPPINKNVTAKHFYGHDLKITMTISRVLTKEMDPTKPAHPENRNEGYFIAMITEDTSQMSIILEKLLSSKYMNEVLNRYNMSLEERFNKPVIGDTVTSATVMLADVEGFTMMSNSMEPIQLLTKLKDIFAIFNKSIASLNRIYDNYPSIQQIKEIGDAVLIVIGVNGDKDHANLAVELCLDVIKRLKEYNTTHSTVPVNMRFGLCSGDVSIGIVNEDHPVLDIYGKTVNFASRLEQSGKIGQVHISSSTFEHVKGISDNLKYTCTLEEIELKGIKQGAQSPMVTKINTYFLKPK